LPAVRRRGRAAGSAKLRSLGRAALPPPFSRAGLMCRGLPGGPANVAAAGARSCPTALRCRLPRRSRPGARALRRRRGRTTHPGYQTCEYPTSQLELSTNSPSHRDCAHTLSTIGPADPILSSDSLPFPTSPNCDKPKGGVISFRSPAQPTRSGSDRAVKRAVTHIR